MVKADAQKLVNEFVEAILKQDEAIHSGNTKDVRRYARKIDPAAKKLIQMGEEGIREFATLLHHPWRRMRVKAAVHLFSSIPDEVLTVLKEIAQGDDFAAECARMRIQEWEEHPEHYDISNWK
jgi:hypothetical protein